HSDQSFYVYYTDSKKGAWSRWQDAKLVRRQVTLNPYGPAPDPVVSPLQLTSNPAPLPPVMEWASVGGYGADFQTGGPADGWTYAWNPTGKLGNSSAFTPL